MVGGLAYHQSDVLSPNATRAGALSAPHANSTTVYRKQTSVAGTHQTSTLGLSNPTVTSPKSVSHNWKHNCEGIMGMSLKSEILMVKSEQAYSWGLSISCLIDHIFSITDSIWVVQVIFNPSLAQYMKIRSSRRAFPTAAANKSVSTSKAAPLAREQARPPAHPVTGT